MRNFNLDHLQTLIAIADLGTFAAAAQALHLAAPTVSLHIKELESKMQAELLVRGRKKAELTKAGEALVHEGRKLLAASDALVELVQRRASRREALVRVGVSAGVSARLLPLMLESLSRRSPLVEVRLEAVASEESMRRLRDATLDIGIVASPQRAVDNVTQAPWRDDEMVALLPGSWDAPDPVTPDWLASRRWASFAPSTQMYGLISAWFGRAGLNPRPFLSLSYPGALKSLAAASQSAAILPLEELQEQLDDESVKVCRLSPPIKRPMAVAYRSLPEPEGAVLAVLQVLQDFSNR